ncbi:hypothetical protein COCOBI_17-2060 [Coccomyxa sp. Obi]|nr:hypothetical protein COCOBI_17-2060 [Coccomyxa sp. Obi]
MDIWTFNVDDDDDDDDELILQSATDSDDEQAHKISAAKRPRMRAGLCGSRQISLLDDIGDLDDLDTKRKQLKDGKSNPAADRSPSSSTPHLKDAPVPEVSKPPRPSVLDPVLQAEALKAKAELERLRRQAEEVAAASASDDDEEEVEEVVATTTTKDSAEQSAADEQKVMLTIKSAKNQGGQKMRIGVNQPLSRLFTAYQQAGQAAGWLPPGTAVTFKFDGDRLKGIETPTSLDLEEDDVIDAIW